MADKAISELLAANQVTPTDLFVLEQSGVAKKLTGQTLENWLLSFADGHGGIQSIVKKGTSGLVDTYRITLADTTTFDFTVTNGKAISSVGQTSVSGLTRTYTIAFNDGTSQTFKVTDGRSITNIAKTGTNGLTDTYTISYNDGTSSTFTVKNGKGIQSFAKVSTDGLVDTYRIEYNDGTFDEFTVTNGAKGDQGDNTYTHIKFASQEPTEASHSFGDVPDKWIGFYWGSSAAAPTDWTQYKWYQFKGDKGDTGSPATLTSAVVEYQVGNSGTIIPSEAWTASVPAVAQGKYLWTRTTQNFNTGSPVVSYSVSRMGLDGAGSVVSVNNVSPNADGNVVLTAEDVSARPNTWLPSIADIGAAPVGYGLGSELVYIEDLNTAIDTGTFWANGETMHIPPEIEHASVSVKKRSSVQSVQTIRAVLSGYVIIRTTTDGGTTWTEEWEVPPMLPNEEYRTTERHNGKVVYARMVDCGGAADNKRITYDWGATSIVRDCGDIDGRSMPYIYTANDNDNSAWYTAHTTAITIWCGSERTNEQVNVTLWYTKG